MNELVRKEAHLATLQVQNKLNILAITPSAPPFNLSVPRVFHVPDLSYNLCSVGQLAELGYRHIFYYSGCIVQDPRTGQELGTGPRVGRMFLVDNLHLPPVAPVSVAAAVSSLPSLALWHSRLGHASSSRVQQLASRGLLGSVSKDNFDCTSCQLGK